MKTVRDRPDWDTYFMSIAHLVSTRSTCLRRQVGAVMVRDKQILTTGYNGVPRGITHCTLDTCLRSSKNIPSGQQQELCRGLHAEQNAIIQAALHGVSTKEATLYCTHQPCVLCAKMLINAGIVRIVYKNSYPDPLADEMLKEARVEMCTWEGKVINY
ncbi:MAG TPA: cytidine/deoxycytidylate deaminase family protein [Candidatus Atribacteria bacterium]|nr:cytidine/deoxycytidylate deaminase family protein [Candidatus Atribacteria bacterium]HPU08870.1 cytidine/deoxycytidylate deaminase family protein [Candidatus Atribacteria bacterium]HQE24832.1 cytidine/deoxycytidylate deaminase family protein [Candidatus Atribacteria bacterium]